MKSNHINYVVLAALLNFFLIICFAPDIASPSFFHDSGGGSFLTIFLILATLSLVFRKAFGAASYKEKFAWFCLAYVIEIYLFREADFHRAFTMEHVTKIKFYTDAGIPFLQRFISGIVMLAFISAFLYLITNHIKPVLLALSHREGWAVALFLWAGLLVVSQLADQSFLNSHSNWRISAIEEMLEISAAAYAATSISLFSLTGVQKQNA